MKPKLKTFLFWIGLIGVLILYFASNRNEPARVVPFGMLESQVQRGDVRSVEIEGKRIRFRSHGRWYEAHGELTEQLLLELQDIGVEPKYGSFSSDSMFEGYRGIVTILVFTIVIFAVLYFIAKMGAGTGGMNLVKLTKSRAQEATGNNKVTFDDVGGCHEAKELLGDVIDFLKAPQRWTKLGVRLPRGILLEGPPGSGKTHLARAVAGETGAKFYVVAASEFVELFVGVGASRVRDMFETAAKNAPSIIFIDEIDAIGRRRGSGFGGSHDEREQTLNQLLVCMDGFQHDARVVVIAATNRPEILDKALLRAGRFDRRIKMPPLTRADRADILKIHTSKKPLGPDVSVQTVADWTDGMCGADLESLANEAALLAVRRARHESSEPVLRLQDFRDALKPRNEQSRLFDQLDSVLIESTSQLSEPTGRAVVRLQLRDGSSVEGNVLWADATFLKIARTDGTSLLVPKVQILRLEAAAGTESVSRENVSEDRWSQGRADLG